MNINISSFRYHKNWHQNEVHGAQIIDPNTYKVVQLEKTNNPTQSHEGITHWTHVEIVVHDGSCEDGKQGLK